MPAVEQLIAQLDSETGQILIEAKIIETQKNISTAKGIDWAVPWPPSISRPEMV